VTFGNAIVKDDTVVLDTGVASGLPGISALKVWLYGPCYPGSSAAAPRLLASLSNAASWQTFTWNTATDAALPGDYVATGLGGAAGGGDRPPRAPPARPCARPPPRRGALALPAPDRGRA